MATSKLTLTLAISANVAIWKAQNYYVVLCGRLIFPLNVNDVIYILGFYSQPRTKTTKDHIRHNYATPTHYPICGPCHNCPKHARPTLTYGFYHTLFFILISWINLLSNPHTPHTWITFNSSAFPFCLTDL